MYPRGRYCLLEFSNKPSIFCQKSNCNYRISLVLLQIKLEIWDILSSGASTIFNQIGIMYNLKYILALSQNKLELSDFLSSVESQIGFMGYFEL